MDLSPEAKRAFQLQSYTPVQAIDGVELVDLKRFSDDGGNFTELVRLGAGRAEADEPGDVAAVVAQELEIDDGGNFTELVRLGAGRAEALRDFTVHQVNY